MVDIKTNDTYYVSNDTGYGYLKTFINGEYFKIPTTLSVLNNPTRYPQTETFSSLSSQEKDDFFENIMTNQYVSFDDGNLLNLSNYRYYVGSSAYDKGESTRVMNTNAVGGKAGQENTYSFILSAIAYKRVVDEYNKNKEEFDFNGTLHANVELMLTALPISESQSDEELESFKNTYLNGVHTVKLHNFKDTDLKVEIKFKKMVVSREGLISKIALYNADKFPKIVDHVQAQLDKDYPEKNYKAIKLLRSQSLVIIDIGAGTTDIVIIINGVPLPMSISVGKGFDDVLNKVVSRLKHEGFRGFSNAHELDKFINKSDEDLSEPQKQIKEYVQELLEIESNVLTDEVMDTFREIMNTGSAQIDVQAVVVIGGGANGTRKVSSLKEELIREGNNMGMPIKNKRLGIPVIWIGESDPKEASILNLLGLQIQLEMYKN